MDKKNKLLFVITSGSNTIYKDEYVVKGNKIIITLDEFEEEMLSNTDIKVEYYYEESNPQG